MNRDIDLVKVMYMGAPADFEVTKRAMLQNCPEEGTGRWVGYATGFLVDGPA